MRPRGVGTTGELTLRLPASTVGVATDCPGLEPELRRRLWPFVDIDAGGAETPDATLVVRAASEPPALPDGPVERVTIQSATIERYRRSGLQVRRDGIAYTLNERGGTLYVTERERRMVTLTGAPAVVVKDARRLVRDLYIADLKRAGHGMLHAGGVVVDGRGVLVTGQKGAGKSTVVFAALRRRGVDLLSNDRTFARADGAAVEAHGVPDHLLVRLGMLRQFPELRSYLPDRYTDMTEDELWQAPDSEKLSIQFQDAAATFGARVVTRTEVACLLVPDYRAERPRATLERLDERATARALAASYHEAVEYRHQPWHRLFELDLAAVAEAQSRLEAAVAERCPTFAVYRGPGSEDVIGAVLDDVVRGRV